MQYQGQIPPEFGKGVHLLEKLKTKREDTLVLLYTQLHCLVNTVTALLESPTALLEYCICPC